MENLFYKALEFVLRWEGGYVNNPNDKGGATNKGITQNTYNAWRKSKGLQYRDVKTITAEEVKEIYYNRYWVAANCHKMTPKFAVACFDTAVNMGVGRIKEFLVNCQFTDIETFFLERIKKYNEFAKTQSQRAFLHGWLNRTFDVYNFINSL